MQVNRTSELARVFGIDFFSVLSRGSQFRVESMLLRLVHTQNYLAISPGNQQVKSLPPYHAKISLSASDI
jgi:DNA polymerase zeta